MTNRSDRAPVSATRRVWVVVGLLLVVAVTASSASVVLTRLLAGTVHSVTGHELLAARAAAEIEIGLDEAEGSALRRLGAPAPSLGGPPPPGRAPGGAGPDGAGLDGDLRRLETAVQEYAAATASDAEPGKRATLEALERTAEVFAERARALVRLHHQQDVAFARLSDRFAATDAFLDDRLEPLAGYPALRQALTEVEVNLAEVGTWLGSFRRTGRPADAELLWVNVEQGRRALVELRAVAPARLRGPVQRLEAHFTALLVEVRTVVDEDALMSERRSGLEDAGSDLRNVLDEQVGPQSLDRVDVARDRAAANARVALAVAVGVGVLCAALGLLALHVVRRHVTRPLRSLVAQIRTASGGERGYRISVTDSSEAEEIAQACNDLLERRERQDAEMQDFAEFQTEFISAASHELRTPLTSIRGYLDLLRDEPERLEADQLHALAVADRNADRLLTVIGDLLTVSRLDGDAFDLEVAEQPLVPVLAETVDAARPGAGARGIDLVLRMEDVSVRACGRATRQVLDNLLSNAVKFTPAGGRVSVSVQAGPDVVRVIVTDTGTGIREEDQDKVFTRFWRTSDAVRSAVPGTGLGLSIARHLAEAQGGELTLSSAHGFGSTFVLALPAARTGSTHATAEPGAPGPSAARDEAVTGSW